MSKMVFVLILSLIFLAACKNNISTPPIAGREVKECLTDNDCIIGGCSGTICQSKNSEPVFTTCEWKSEYTCYKQIGCKCILGKCDWEKTAYFDKCVEESRKSDSEAIV